MYSDIQVKLSKFDLQEGDLLLVQGANLPVHQAENLRQWIVNEYPGISVLVLAGQPTAVVRISKGVLKELGAAFDKQALEVDMQNKQVRLGQSTTAQVRNTIRNIQGFVNSSAELQQISPVATRALNAKLHQLEELIESCLNF